MTVPYDDPSGAEARTLLAWSRMAVTAVTFATVAVRLLPGDFGGRWWTALLALTLAVAAEVYGYRAYHHDTTVQSRQRAIALLAAGVAALAAAAFMLVLF